MWLRLEDFLRCHSRVVANRGFTLAGLCMNDRLHLWRPTMRRSFTLEYWLDDGWYVGRLKEVPGVFSQGETLEELEANIEDAYDLMRTGIDEPVRTGSQVKQVELEV
jgi:predicted RNase H-like HicB family nuclease